MPDRLRLQQALRTASDPLVTMERIVDAALGLIPGAEGTAIELVGAEGLTFVCCAGMLAPAIGLRLGFEDSLSGLAVRSGATLWCTDTETDPRVDRDACRFDGSRSMVVVPLRRNGQPVGVLKVSSSQTGVFSERDVATLTGLAEFVSVTIMATTELSQVVGHALGASELRCGTGVRADTAGISAFVAAVSHPGVADEVEAATRIDEVLETGSFVPLFQPVVALKTRKLVGVEALTRFLPGPYRTPDVWFEEAHRFGRGAELEFAAVAKALSFAADLPERCYVAVNFGPDALGGLDTAGVLDGIDPYRVVIELTEHVQIDDYPGLRRTLAALRGRGVRLAVDDTGSGFSSFSHIVKLAPDLIKVDIDLIRGIDADPVRRSLVGAVVMFATDTGATVVAEGIETQAELDTLCHLGVTDGQGYLLGHPGPIELLDAYRVPTTLPS